MSNTPNKLKEDYMIAKECFDKLVDERDCFESQYIKHKGIVNPDGTVPRFICCIKDRKVFDNANEEYSNLAETTELCKRVLDAKEEFFVKEESLIEYALSITPKKECEILRKKTKESYNARQSLIELVLHLDVSTVK